MTTQERKKVVQYRWDDVGRMLMAFEGFQVKLEIYDKSEER